MLAVIAWPCVVALSTAQQSASPPARYAPGSIGGAPRWSGSPAGGDRAQPIAAQDDIPPAAAVPGLAAGGGRARSPFDQSGPPGAPALGQPTQALPASSAPGDAAAGTDRYAPRPLGGEPDGARALSPWTDAAGGQARSADETNTGAGKPGTRQLEGPQAPSLTLEKIFPPEVQVNKPATLEIRVRNVGAVPAHQVEIHDEIPQGAQLLSTTPRATRGTRGELVWAVGTLPAGQDVTVQCELLPTAEGELGSVARVQFAAEASGRTICTRPDLAITVESPREVMIGEDMAIKIRISNPGTGVATGVLLAEHVPPNVEHPAGAELEYDIGQLQPKETRELVLSLHAAKPGVAVNLLTAHGDGQLQAEQRTPVAVIAPALDVKLEGPRRRFLDRQAVYTVWVSNPGTASAQGVELAATLPPGFKFVDANNSGRFDPATRRVQWLLEELPPNQKGSVTLTALPIEAGEQVITIESTAQRGLNVEKQEQVLVEGVAAIMFEVADLADPVELGGETTYEVKVINQGSKAASNVRLTALMPPEIKTLSCEGPTRFAVDGQQVRFQELPRLAPKASTVYRMRVQCQAAGDMRVRVQLTTDDIRAPITKEESTRVYSDQ
ncbi:MAG TPA: hypothetical protein VHV55_13815 [Pirellulales bacterium]|jgi:uncharacterized repeat protein (TIGR01451 family)|nr:hypothetical protein [Pirellulales bacterium]